MCVTPIVRVQILGLILWGLTEAQYDKQSLIQLSDEPDLIRKINLKIDQWQHDLVTWGKLFGDPRLDSQADKEQIVLDSRWRRLADDEKKRLDASRSTCKVDVGDYHRFPQEKRNNKINPCDQEVLALLSKLEYEYKATDVECKPHLKNSPLYFMAVLKPLLFPKTGLSHAHSLPEECFARTVDWYVKSVAEAHGTFDTTNAFNTGDVLWNKKEATHIQDKVSHAVWNFWDCLRNAKAAEHAQNKDKQVAQLLKYQTFFFDNVPGGVKRLVGEYVAKQKNGVFNYELSKSDLEQLSELPDDDLGKLMA